MRGKVHCLSKRLKPHHISPPPPPANGENNGLVWIILFEEDVYARRLVESKDQLFEAQKGKGCSKGNTCRKRS
eukprot:519505-Amphidinium_carterae.1